MQKTSVALRIITLLLSVALIWPPLPVLAADIQLPSLGEEAGAFSLSQEREIGAEFMRSIKGQLALVDDPTLNAYLNDMGYALLAQMNPLFKDYRFFIANDGSINAFAAPGGYVVVNSGLILSASNESQLAAVLAHELTHVNQRHISRAIAQSQNMQVPMMAALLAGLFLLGSNPKLGEAVLTSSAAYNAKEQLRFSREHEQEADRIGIDALAAAGYDPEGMPAFFERLQNWSRIQGGNPMEFLSTHPLTLGRLADTRNRAIKLASKIERNDLPFQRMQIRLKALTAANEATLASFRKQAQKGKGNEQELGRYGMGLVLQQQAQNQDAVSVLKTLNQQVANVQLYQLALADALQQDRQYNEALRLYRQILRNQPSAALAQEGLANTLYAAKDYNNALEAVNVLIRQFPEAPRFYDLLAKIRFASGDPVGGHRALAEHYLLGGTAVHQGTPGSQHAAEDARAMGRYASKEGAILRAVQQLKIAKNQSENPVDSAAIEARLREMQAMLVEAKAGDH